MSHLTFKQYVLIEAREGDRVGIPHLYHPAKPHLSMEYNTFVKFINQLNKERGVIKNSNAGLSEKADGIALKFGFQADGRFFMQSSYSGIVTDPEEFESKIKYPPVKEAFKNNFYKLQELVRPALVNLKNGVIIQAEWLYSPLALERENKPGNVYFVATDYDVKKLGTWSTFVIINCTDLNGKELPNVANKLTKLTTEEVKFLLAHIDVFPDINLRNEVVAANNVISQINKDYPDLQEVISSKSLKRDEVAKRKQYKEHIQKAISPIQEQVYQKILSVATTVAGRLGDFEGFVLKLTVDGNPFMFKVNTPTFFTNKDQKDRDERGVTLKESKNTDDNGDDVLDPPTVVLPDGAKMWFDSNRQLHRDKGPAYVTKDVMQWYKNGKCHREDGPAVVFKGSNTRGWFLDGEIYGNEIEHQKALLKYKAKEEIQSHKNNRIDPGMLEDYL